MRYLSRLGAEEDITKFATVFLQELVALPSLCQNGHVNVVSIFFAWCDCECFGPQRCVNTAC